VSEPPTRSAAILTLLLTDGARCVDCIAMRVGDEREAVIAGVAKLADQIKLTRGWRGCPSCGRAGVVIDIFAAGLGSS
jgi:hypothetical protein